MDISFSTGAGGGAWSLGECAKWAEANGFDAIRPNASGDFDPNHILQVEASFFIDTKRLVESLHLYHPQSDLCKKTSVKSSTPST